MCRQCETKPVYEFTNQRKLCANCFVRWFQKKVLYTMRKFGMIQKGDVVAYEKRKDFRSVVLEDVLKMFAERADAELVVSPPNSQPRSDLISFHHKPQPPPHDSLAKSLAHPKLPAHSRSQINEVVNKKKISKFAIWKTIDMTAYEITNGLIEEDIQKLKVKPVEGKLIKPLYLFLDKEVLLYAKLRGLKFSKRDSARPSAFHPNDLQKFINDLEKKHPEVKNAVVQGWLKINS